MAKPYSPQLPTEIIKALYFEGRRLGVPMTRLAARLLKEALRKTPGWLKAKRELAEDTSG